MENFTVREIASALDVTPRWIRKRATKESWVPVSSDDNDTSVVKYNYHTLPEDIKSTLKTHYVSLRSIEERATQAANFEIERDKLAQERSKAVHSDTSELINLDDRTKAALLIVKYARSSITESGKISSFKCFVDAYNSKSVELNESVYKVIPKLSNRTLQRWEKAYEKNGIEGLKANYGKNKGKGKIDSTSEMYRYCVALIHQFPHIKGQRLAELLKMEFGGKYPTPSPSSCRDWLRKWKDENKTTFLSLMDASGWQNKHMAAFGSRSAGVERINQLWEFDSTPADVMLTDGRYSIIGVIDVFTRRVKVVLKPTSNAEGIALLIRNTILDWGIPEVARTDNGADYCSAHIFAIWDALGIHNQITNPYSGWEKPFIERFFRTFSHGIAEMLSGYIGHNVSDREKINARLTFAQRLIERREKGADRVALDVSISSTDFEKFI
ncbi:MAG TPA: integrase, partial [Pseudoalteromonas sp.]|nr:integrase [Pseudoalteromonas sp.]